MTEITLSLTGMNFVYFRLKGFFLKYCSKLIFGSNATSTTSRISLFCKQCVVSLLQVFILSKQIFLDLTYFSSQQSHHFTILFWALSRFMFARVNFNQACGPCWENIGLEGLAKTNNTQRNPHRQDLTNILLASSPANLVSKRFISHLYSQ